MPPDESAAIYMRTALDAGAPQSHRAALDALAKSNAPLPAPFISALLIRAPAVQDHQIGRQLTHLIASQLQNAQAQAAVKKGITSLTNTWRKQPPSFREALTSVKCIAPLVRFSAISPEIVQLLILAIATVEAASVPPNGHLNHTKAKVLASTYRHAVRAMSSAPPAAFSTALKIVERYTASPSQAVAALAMIAPNFKALDPKDCDRLLVTITTMSMKGGPSVAEKVARVASAPLSAVSEQTLLTTLIPIIDRALLREPEAALGASAHFFRVMSGKDISSAIGKSILPAVIQALKSADAATRSQAVLLADVLAPCVHDRKVLQGAVSSMFDALTSARYAYQKVATIDTIVAFCFGRFSKDISKDVLPINENALVKLKTWLSTKKERNEETRSAGIGAMVTLFSRCLTIGDSDGDQDSVFEGIALFFSDVLVGKYGDSDRRALLLGLTKDLKSSIIPAKYFNSAALGSLRTIVSNDRMIKQDDSLRSLAILSNWIRDGVVVSSDGVSCTNILSDLDFDFSSAHVEHNRFATLNEVQCALRCYEWMISSAHSHANVAIECIFQLCLDERPRVSAEAVEMVRELRKSGDDARPRILFNVLWRSHFQGSRAESSIARSYEFDDGNAAVERLGKVLLAVVLPIIPVECIPFILLASNHPRLHPGFSSTMKFPSSRFWCLVERNLDKVDGNSFSAESDDWLEQCLSVIFGENGLQSKDQTSVTASINALSTLANDRNPYSMRVLRRAVELMRPFTSDVSHLFGEELDTLTMISESNLATEIAGPQPLLKTPYDEVKKFQQEQLASTKQSKRANGQKKAGKERTRPAPAISSTASANAATTVEVALATIRSIELFRIAICTVQALATIAPAGIHNLAGSVLSVVLSACRVELLELPCRRTLSDLIGTSTRRLSGISEEITDCLYALESDSGAQKKVSTIIQALKSMIPPVLSSGDFSVVSPLIRAALVRDPNSGRQSMANGRASVLAMKKEAVAVAKAAAEVLREHCKPEAFESAMIAAASRAGTWAICALEREDGSFSPAADVLSFLTETVLTPGTTHLSQVLEGVLSGKSSVRDVTLSALARLPQLSEDRSVLCPRDAMLGRTLWLARFDPENENSLLADSLWFNYNNPLNVSEDVPNILALIAHKEADIRIMASRAVADAVVGLEHEDIKNFCITSSFEMYLKNVPGEVARKEPTDRDRKLSLLPKHGEAEKAEIVIDEEWMTREGVALFVERMASSEASSMNDLTMMFSFLSKYGLGDSNDHVRSKMSHAAIAVVEAAGEEGPSVLLPIIELHLNQETPTSLSTEKVLHEDRTRENLVMCLGIVASFLPTDDPRVSRIADQVMRSAMETPSEVVQNAAAKCLARLAPASITADREQEVLEKLTSTVWNDTSSYGERRGAAYVLAGITSGLGLKFMKRIDVIHEIESAVAEKSARRRQGALVLVETFAIMLGRTFEPYAVASVPLLLSCMSDSAVDVRNSCWAAAQAAMAELSSQGVKMVLPFLLEGLKERQWRKKAGCAEVLGAMAFCAPRQLAQCLPQVVPKLADALSDAHSNVVSAAESAINRIVAVVQSPEVRSLSPFLLNSLRDPANGTRGAIDAMLGTEFTHAIDAASLSLLIPPLHRGLRDRSSELKKRSAAIVGSMCNNVSSQFDVLPYLDLLLPALRVTLFDAIPEVRQTSARAIGALSVSLGEEGLPEVVPWLVKALTGQSMKSVREEHSKIGSNTVSSSVERSGAAMGLAEVTASMSEKRLDDVISLVLGARSTSSEAMEGSLMFISYLPQSLGEQFENRLGSALSVILLGLSDDSDNVREAALAAGRSVVSAYAKTSLDRLLPELLFAMRERLWRMRQAATKLLGDLLLTLSGVNQRKPGTSEPADVPADDENEKDSDAESDDVESDEEEAFVSPEEALTAISIEARMNTIQEVLGANRCSEVLAALYIIRCDVSIAVRQTGMQVWKAVVSNTPRVLREILPFAVQQIVDGLGDEDEERRAAAGRTLSELSQKLGDRVVPEVLPALRTGISNKTADSRIRKGACEGLSELVLASSQEQIETNAKDLIDATYEALCDDLQAVRIVAAEVFSFLLKLLGVGLVDAVVPMLIQRLSVSEHDESEALEIALDGLKQIMKVSGPKLMPLVMPQLLVESPKSLAQARAIATAAVVGESSFESYVSEVVNYMVECIESMETNDWVQRLEVILVAMSSRSNDSTKELLDEVVRVYTDEHPGRRAAASRICGTLCRSALPERIGALAGSLFEAMIAQLADPIEDVSQAAWEGLKEMTKSVPSRALSVHIPLIRQSLRTASLSITEGSAKIPGLQIPRAPEPFVPVIIEGLLHGAPELREQAALAVGDIVELTNPSSLKPFVVKLTGPLIRVMSDRFPWQVRAAILRALLMLLKEASAMLRTFAPQLQSTFMKCLSDEHRLVRVRASAALGHLSIIQTRVEALLNDLVSLGTEGASGSSRVAALYSCSQIFRQRENMPESVFSNIPPGIIRALSDEEDDVATAATQTLGIISGRCTATQYEAVLQLVVDHLEVYMRDNSTGIYAQKAIGAMYLSGCQTADLTIDQISESLQTILELSASDDPALCGTASSALGSAYELLHKNSNLTAESSQRKEVLASLVRNASYDSQPDVKIAAVSAMKGIIHLEDSVLQTLGPALVACAADARSGIRNAADAVLRHAFISQNVVRQDRVSVARAVLSAEDWTFIDRRLAKLCARPEWADGAVV